MERSRSDSPATTVSATSSDDEDKTLPRVAIQPSGHNKMYFLPNLELLENESHDPLVVDMMRAAEAMRPHAIVQTDEAQKALVLKTLNEEMQATHGFCDKLEPEYIADSLEDNFAIMMYVQDRSLRLKDTQKQLPLVFATVRLENKTTGNGRKVRALVLDLLCSNPKFKYMGTKLMDDVVEFAAHAGCDYVMLQAVNTAVDFYKKLGFKLTNPNKQYRPHELVNMILDVPRFLRMTNLPEEVRPGFDGGRKHRRRTRGRRASARTPARKSAARKRSTQRKHRGTKTRRRRGMQ